MRILTSFFAIIFSLVLLQACTHYGSEVNKHADLSEGEYIVVRFPPGKDRLLESEKLKLIQFKNAIEGRANVDSIEVLAWSDQEYPVEGVAKPSMEEQRLAADRGQVVKEFLKKDLGSKKDVDVHNMAKEPGVFAKIFTTDEFRMKDSLESSAEIGFVSDNKESKAVILVKYE
ncbi:hypothetical protein AZI86_09045 [Bdellovibrio bacteriovorus]|uniref:OmpA-like domain-containing protein n=1 Tax=Bdellovibrio bacteriovorus TaxID=959 RepID=A0A150WS47_BDEBC|nr:hypothetical protein [Bdellovibrio bacteriovorus]KYG67147.1 hypothetical protein AZI86_09045 [Bdellovibrio bacteriovorus]